MSTLESMRESLENATRALNDANESEVHSFWLEIVRLQESIDNACARHAPYSAPMA